MSLERSYRRLLLTYPRSYRERRGEEIIATLMDDASPEQTRPDRRTTVDLVLGGVRQRLGLHNPDGLVAGAALAAPVCLTLAAVDAVNTMVNGPRSAGQLVVTVAWLIVVAVWAAVPRVTTVATAIAITVTVAASVTGQPYEFWRVLCWGLTAFIGCLSARAPSLHRERMVRFGVPVTVAVLSALSMVFRVPPTADDSGFAGPGAVWSGVVSDLAAIGAVATGVAVAGRGRARFTWAAFVVLGAWLATGGGGTSYLIPSGPVVALVGVIVMPIPILVAALVLAAVAVRRPGPGARGLHRAGSVAIGYAGGYVLLPLLDLVRGGETSYWSDVLEALVWADVTPYGLMALGLLVVPALVDPWAPPWVQRFVIGVAIVGAGGAWALDPAHPIPLPMLIYMLLLGLGTRGGGHRDRGAFLGLGLGMAAMLLIAAWDGARLTLDTLMALGSAISVLIPLSVLALSAVLFTDHRWWGPVAFAVGALWLVGISAPHLTPFMVVCSGVVLLGLAVAQARSAGTQPFDPTGESA